MIHRTFLLALVFFVQTNLSTYAQTACNQSNGNYTNNPTYSSNLNITLSSLTTNINNNVFYNASTGQGIDKANAVALCRGDLQLNTCRNCVQTAATELLQSCPNQKQAIIWGASSWCMVRYSNTTIIGILTTYPAYYVWNIQNATSPEQFKADLRVLMDDLMKKAAAGSSLMKVAAGNVTGPDFQTIFGLLQCTPDLSSEDCTTCLVGAISDIAVCCDGKRGGKVLLPSCNLFFDSFVFFNETRLQELEQVLSTPLTSSPGKDNGKTTRTILIIVVAIGVSLILAVSVIIFLRKKMKQKLNEKYETVDEISSAESLQYGFSTIEAATNNFSLHNKLGQGGFGTVYKGKLPNGRNIAVKRLSTDSGQGDLEFKNEIILLAKLQHRNLVRLLGFALEGMEKLLVYEFVENGSLDQYIFDSNNHSKLEWDERHKIIVGIARGILYLHEDSRLKIIHRDLKASNILLDSDMNPKISDFGMARLFRQDETQGNTSRIVGTYGYMPPEYLFHGQFSIKSDVFSFGVLVLELISGLKNNSSPRREGVEDLVSFAWKSWEEGRVVDVVDPILRFGLGSINEMVRYIHIGLLCVQEDASNRPTMASVVLMLSSFTVTLARPSHPAFHYSTGFGSDVSRIDDYGSTSSDRKKTFLPQDQSVHNDSLNTELYPR